MGEASKAEDAFREAIRLDGKRASAHLNYAAFLSLHGRLDVAIQHYRIALSLDPSSKLARRNLLLALLQTGSFSQAEKMARTLPRADPTRVSVLAKIDSLRAVNGRE